MKRVASAVVCVAMLVSGAEVGRTAEGYVGIYGDSAGTTPCVTVPQTTVATLYVLATTAGQSAAGVTGAELRIEATNPDGWLFMFDSSAPTVVGNLVDVYPDSADNSGVNIAFDTCQAPDENGKVLLGTILVYNMSGDATDLLVRRHSNPSNPFYSCPLLTLCDSTFAKVCMGLSGEAPCSVSPLKGVSRIGSSEDPAIFGASLNRNEIDPVIETFTETLSLGSCELWVLGHPIPGPWVTLEFDGDIFTIGGVELLTEISNPPPPNRGISDTGFLRLYGQAPYTQELLANGATVSEANTRFFAAVDSLEGLVSLAAQSQNLSSANDFLVASPLVDPSTIVLSKDDIQFKLDGDHYPRRFSKTVHVADPTVFSLHKVPHRMLKAIKRSLSGGLILVSRGGLRHYTLDSADQVRIQVAHLRGGGDLSTLPPGPLRRDSQFTLDIHAAAQGGQR